MKRRLTAVFLILAMLTGLFPLQVWAEDDTQPSAQSVFLSQSQVQLQVGQQITLTATVEPESAAAAAKWVSQDESIATVEDGVITAVAAGATTVSYEVGSLRALCSVTVTQKTRDVSQDEEITVYFSILGDVKHGSSGTTHTLTGGTLTYWVEQAACRVQNGSTVLELIEMVAKEKGYACTIRSGEYLVGIDGLNEFTNGPLSGWKYLLNGSYSGASICDQKLKQGDAIVLHYTDDYFQDDNNNLDTDKIGSVIKGIKDLKEEVTLQDAVAIKNVRTAYDQLTDGQKFAVSNAILLTAAERKLEELPVTVDGTIAIIDALPDTITLDQEDAVEFALAAYDLLTEEEKKGVTNSAKLKEAENCLNELKATEISKLINAIPEQTDENFEQAVLEAKQAYDGLTEKQQALVENVKILQEAVQKLNQSKADPVIALIAEIPEEISLTDEEKILQARSAYDALSEDQKALVTNSSDLFTAETKLEILKLPAADRIYQQTGDYLENRNIPDSGVEWIAVGLTRSRRDVSEGYYNCILNYITENIDKDERLHPYNSTNNSRTILALTAMGYDVTNVAGHNLLNGLNEMEYIQWQGINGPIWALIALDSHSYTPTGDVTREKLLKCILSAQLTDGGWALAWETAEPDLTAMAIQALAPHYSKSNVKSAVDKALTRLSIMQSSDGGYALVGTATCESAAQVVVALSALGIDPDTDSRFVKNGISVLDAMCTFAVDGGGFAHVSGGGINSIATEQGYYALTAYFRMKEGKNSLYNMSDVTIVKTRYPILSGGDGIWNTDAKTHTIVVNGPHAEFLGVKVDGVTIDDTKYTAKSGSTIVTFKEDYLKTLSLGKHSITLVFKNCTITTSLNITESDAELAQDVIDLIAAIGKVTNSSQAKINAARTAYNALTEAQKKLVSNYSDLLDAEKAYADLAEKITVSFTLLGDTAHGENGQEHTLAGGGLRTWISKTSYTLLASSTVLDLLTKALSGKYAFTNAGNYISSINGLSEFTNGKYSGWMYTLNGKHSSLGVEEQKLKNGDSVVFHYTDNYVTERSGVSTAKETAVEEVIKLINNIGTVTLTDTCKAKINAARKAYDNLTGAQKKLVTNYKTLTDAETALAMLMATDEDKATAQAVIDKINKLGQITLDSEADVKAAREAYDKLTDLQKALVTNYNLLEAAEKTLAALKDGKSYEGVWQSTGDYLETLGTPGVGAIGGEWMVIGLARSGREVPEGYYENAVKYVTENIDANGRLHSSKSSENARMILALTAIGKDVTDVGGHNLLLGLNDMDFIQKQGINGPMWALIALDCGNYPAPDGGDVSREALIQVILDAQLADGGWTLAGENADPDMTGMALQALAPYYNRIPSLQTAVDKAVALLSEMQDSDGTYSGIDGASSESLAQVIVALTALNIDPHTDARFIKNGMSAVDALLQFAVSDGGFRHVLTGDRDGMATEQGYYALTAYKRFLEKKLPLYRMTDVIDRDGLVELDSAERPVVEDTPAETESEENHLWWILLAGGLICFAVALSLIVYGKFWMDSEER